MASGLAHISRHFFVLVIVLQLPAILHASNNVTVGSALFAIDDNSAWTSPSGDFAFVFRRLPGEEDQFLLAIWSAKLPEQTVVWSANRNYPAERESKVELTAAGQLVLSVPSGSELWKSKKPENATVSHGALLDTGNFVITTGESSIIWDSFSEPTDTILPTQVLGFKNPLLSSIAENNYQGSKFNLRFIRGNVSDGNTSYDLVINQIDVHTGNPYGAYFTDPDVSELILDQSGFLQARNSRSHNISNFTAEPVLTGPDYYHRATLDFDGIFRLYHRRKNSNGNDSWSVIGHFLKTSA